MSVKQSVAYANTDLPPAALLFKPDDPNIAVVGTYFLEPEDSTEKGESVNASKQTQEKRGEIVLYDISNNNFKKCCSVSLPAVYNFKFVPGDSNTLVAAHPEGKISVVRLETTPSNFSAIVLAQHTLSEEAGVSILDVQFSPADPSIAAVSLSSGELLLCKYDREGASFTVDDTLQPHTLEAWTVEFSKSGEVLYSGGDDSVLAVSSVQDGLTLWTNRKIHGAGVTAILELSESLILTGSYDEYLRVVNTTTRRQINECHLGGGVWRLHWISESAGLLLASCMHIGTKVLKVSKDGTDIDIFASFEENKSMNYASHVHPSKPGRILSSSFYDKALFLWDWN